MIQRPFAIPASVIHGALELSVSADRIAVPSGEVDISHEPAVLLSHDLILPDIPSRPLPQRDALGEGDGCLCGCQCGHLIGCLLLSGCLLLCRLLGLLLSAIRRLLLFCLLSVVHVLFLLFSVNPFRRCRVKHSAEDICLQCFPLASFPAPDIMLLAIQSYDCLIGGGGHLAKQGAQLFRGCDFRQSCNKVSHSSHSFLLSWVSWFYVPQPRCVAHTVSK